jgi:hypothetical protein
VIYAVAVAVACWGVAVYGLVSLATIRRRMTRERTVFPVGGMRVASTRIAARLADLPGESGTYQGLLWARSADGLACRGARRGFGVIGECRQEGDDVVVDAVLPHAVRLIYVGMLGFLAVIVTTVLSVDAPRDWALAIPVALLVGVAVQYVLHVRRARAAGRLMPRFLEAACGEAAAVRAGCGRVLPRCQAPSGMPGDRPVY